MRRGRTHARANADSAGETTVALGPLGHMIGRLRALGQIGLVRRLVKNFSIGLVGSVATAAVGVGRTVVLTKVLLDVEAYGRLLIVLNFFSLLEAVASVRVHETLYKFWPQYEIEKDTAALRTLFLLAFGVSGGVGLLCLIAVLTTADWVALTLYEDASLTLPLRLYAGAIVLLSLNGVASTLLRLEDRFAAVIIPQVVGGILTLLLLIAYAVAAETYQIRVVVLIFLVGIIAQATPTVVQAFRSTYRRIGGVRGARWSALAGSKSEIYSLLFQSNLTGYLKMLSSPGDLFLLGVFGTPTQVAFYGIAQRLLRPVRTLLQRNANMAISPEVVKLWAENKFGQIARLLRHYLMIGVGVSAGAVGVALLLDEAVIHLVSGPEYLAAAPVFNVSVLAACVTLVSVPFYAVSISMNWIYIRNIVLISSSLLYFVFMSGGLTAIEVAYVQLAIMVMMVLFHDSFAYLKVKKMSVIPGAAN